MPRDYMPPPTERFHWDQWEPYPYPRFRSPADPPPDAVIYRLKMGPYEVARIWLQPDGRWDATVGLIWAEKFQHTATIEDEASARARVEAWAQRRFDDLHRTRPTAYWGVGGPKRAD